MANGHGGARRPANPAPVSGPGAMSRRTDGGPSQPARYMAGGEYGDGQAMMDLQTSAPMAASPTPQTQAQSVGVQPGAAAPTPLDAPTERPDEPLTHGNPMGPGAGPEVLTFGSTRQESLKSATALKKYLPALIPVANSPGAPPDFVRIVRYIRDAPDA